MLHDKQLYGLAANAHRHERADDTSATTSLQPCLERVKLSRANNRKFARVPNAEGYASIQHAI